MKCIRKSDGEAHEDYRLLAQAMRIYIAQHLLSQSPDDASPSIFSKNHGKTLLTLTVITQLRASQREVTTLLLSDPERAVGIRGIWHHGVEELFYVQQEGGQMFCRSLRHHDDETVEHGLHWLRSHLLTWHQLV